MLIGCRVVPCGGPEACCAALKGVKTDKTKANALRFLTEKEPMVLEAQRMGRLRCQVKANVFLCVESDFEKEIEER